MTNDSSSTAHRAIALLDLTELGDHATVDDVTALCTRAIGPHGKVAAVCVWPRHVAHAARFVKPDGVLVAIMSPSWQTRDTSAAAAFRQFAKASQADVKSIPAGAFRESGTDVATVLVRMDACNFPWNRADADLDGEPVDDAAADADDLAAADLPRG